MFLSARRQLHIVVAGISVLVGAPVIVGGDSSAVAAGHPASPANAFLESVDAVSGSDVWAVGHYGHDGPKTLSEHWDGSAWTVVPTVDTPSNFSMLFGVSAVAGNDVWAVGVHGRHANNKTLIEHWDGQQWSIVPSPNVPGDKHNRLVSVSAVNASDVWAVGYYHDNYWDGRTLTEHWDGHKWSIVPSPNPYQDGHELLSVSAVSANDVWAVGARSFWRNHPLMLHWDGTTWENVPISAPDKHAILNAVVGVSATEAFAVGALRPYGVEHSWVEHWDGSSWSTMSAPNPQGDAELLGIDALDPNHAWTVGDDAGLGGRQLAEHWNGSSWRVVGSPPSREHNGYFLSVRMISGRDAWAVGYDLIHDKWHPLVDHWDGKHWTQVTTPSP